MFCGFHSTLCFYTHHFAFKHRFSPNWAEWRSSSVKSRDRFFFRSPKENRENTAPLWIMSVFQTSNSVTFLRGYTSRAVHDCCSFEFKFQMPAPFFFVFLMAQFFIFFCCNSNKQKKKAEQRIICKGRLLKLKQIACVSFGQTTPPSHRKHAHFTSINRSSHHPPPPSAVALNGSIDEWTKKKRWGKKWGEKINAFCSRERERESV